MYKAPLIQTVIGFTMKS
uniref:Uncharacterized protein n=1 Tax=Rhizophora mucronata TaxID=61149 RepID=A0A2P2Q9W5_RHIMU